MTVICYRIPHHEKSNGYVKIMGCKKAFDQVSHKRLAVKLESYGITSKLLKWISCFLSNRLQWVKVGTSCSNKSNVTRGIPQGSILGPTLFALYINDLPNSLTSQCKMFADE